MATWNSRGLRGSALEELVNRTNEKYEQSHLALIQKIPTPITPVKLDKASHQITLAYFEQQSTVDYIGAVQGIPVCFDAKECRSDTFPLSNIHEHQVYFMEEFERQDGVAFVLIQYTERQTLYYLTFRQLMIFWRRMLDGGRKSFRYDELDPAYEIKPKPGILIDVVSQGTVPPDRSPFTRPEFMVSCKSFGKNIEVYV